MKVIMMKEEKTNNEEMGRIGLSETVEWMTFYAQQARVE